MTTTLAGTLKFMKSGTWSDAKTGSAYDTNTYDLLLSYDDLTTFATTYGSYTIQMRNVVTDVTGKIKLYD